MRAVVDAAEHDAVGVHEVGDGDAFGEELGVHADAEIAAGLLPRGLFEQRAGRRVGRAGDDGALDDDDVVAASSSAPRRSAPRSA